MKMRFGIILLAGVLAACATTPGGEEEGTGADLVLRVNNNLVPPTVVTIYFAPESGIERSLGVAYTSRITEFRYRGLQPKGRYRLVARATDDRMMGSAVVVMDGVTGLEWTLQSNFVTVTSTTRDQ